MRIFILGLFLMSVTASLAAPAPEPAPGHEVHKFSGPQSSLTRGKVLTIVKVVKLVKPHKLNSKQPTTKPKLNGSHGPSYKVLKNKDHSKGKHLKPPRKSKPVVAIVRLVKLKVYKPKPFIVLPTKKQLVRERKLAKLLMWLRYQYLKLRIGRKMHYCMKKIMRKRMKHMQKKMNNCLKHVKGIKSMKHKKRICWHKHMKKHKKMIVCMHKTSKLPMHHRMRVCMRKYRSIHLIMHDEMFKCMRRPMYPMMLRHMYLLRRRISKNHEKKGVNNKSLLFRKKPKRHNVVVRLISFKLKKTKHKPIAKSPKSKTKSLKKHKKVYLILKKLYIIRPSKQKKIVITRKKKGNKKPKNN